MGELASGVAHEIRNPINAIGMIAQRLQKEFSPDGGNDEFNSITNLLRTEVTRINKIIKQFLDYAKPLEVRPEEVDADEYFKQVYQLFEGQADKRRVTFTIHGLQSLHNQDRSGAYEAGFNEPGAECFRCRRRGGTDWCPL